MDPLADAGGRPILDPNPVNAAPPNICVSYGNYTVVPVNNVWAYNPRFMAVPVFNQNGVQRTVSQESACRVFAIPRVTESRATDNRNSVNIHSDINLKPDSGASAAKFQEEEDDDDCVIIANPGPAVKDQKSVSKNPVAVGNNTTKINTGLLPYGNGHINQETMNSNRSSHLNILRGIHEKICSSQEMTNQGENYGHFQIRPGVETHHATTRTARMRGSVRNISGHGASINMPTADNGKGNTWSNPSPSVSTQQNGFENSTGPSMAKGFQITNSNIQNRSCQSTLFNRQEQLLGTSRCHAGTSANSNSNKNTLLTPKLEPGTEMLESSVDPWDSDFLASSIQEIFGSDQMSVAEEHVTHEGPSGTAESLKVPSQSKAWDKNETASFLSSVDSVHKGHEARVNCSLGDATKNTISNSFLPTFNQTEGRQKHQLLIPKAEYEDMSIRTGKIQENILERDNEPRIGLTLESGMSQSSSSRNQTGEKSNFTKLYNSLSIPRQHVNSFKEAEPCASGASVTSVSGNNTNVVNLINVKQEVPHKHCNYLKERPVASAFTSGNINAEKLITAKDELPANSPPICKVDEENSPSLSSCQISSQRPYENELTLLAGERSNLCNTLALLEEGVMPPVPPDFVSLAQEMSGRKRKRALVLRVPAENAEIHEGDDREKITNALLLFDALRRNFWTTMQLEESSRDAARRPDLKAAALMSERELWVNRGRRVIGPVPGVHIGDHFYYRIELCIIGLHGQIQAGIDFINRQNSGYNEPIAVSVIASGGYADDEDQGDVLIYTGQGGNNYVMDKKQAVDQKLERGNLALERSMHFGFEIRVIRGIKEPKSPTGKIYIYDGLYKVEDSWLDTGRGGCGIFKYRLQRLPDQPELGSEMLKRARSWKSAPLSRPNLLNQDLSFGCENIPVCVANEIDYQEPPPFVYTTRPMYPPSRTISTVKKCECFVGCHNNPNCICVQANGPQSPYIATGVLVKWKRLIYECGIHCSCPSTCRNRLTQQGLKIHLEVFRAADRRWGVMSWDPIPAGTFLCEYTGEIVPVEGEAVLSTSENYVLDVQKAQRRWTQWGNVSDILGNDLQGQCSSTTALPPLNFLIDAREMGNVSRFINHSSSPNVIMQLVAQGSGVHEFPRVMLFAREHIPPLTELFMDYGHDTAV
eukprot:TRINITY_DN5550_c0_g1_i1.p1 TRINITY_DN5550_c0_g1~~TRINITY_DN5550_c0_g1_i1.p1  ORF type:complete len:1158 (+),score=198.12 TRINITY_DN5550_c0_g1_i1:167-3640(+)